VQNALLNLLPVEKREAAAGTLNTILLEASWRKKENGDLAIGSTQGQAEGDVLENVVNALADLILGPQVKNQRLNGSPDDGLVDYYDENGRSTRKFLIRQPIATIGSSILGRRSIRATCSASSATRPSGAIAK
jgi:hypothetical protein